MVPVGTAQRTTPFRIASLTKPFTAVAALLAMQRTAAGLETPVFDTLPELHGDWAADKTLTIGQVLSQTSGLAPTVTAEDVGALGDSSTVAMDVARLVVRAGSARPPGHLWEYYNGNYFLAGAVITALMEMTYEEALEELILRPWALESTSFDPPASLAPGVDGGSTPAVAYPRGRRPSGGLCSTADDLLTFGERVLAEPDLLARVQTVATRHDDPMRYGLGWAIGPSAQLYLNGRLPGYRAALMLVPSHGVAGVALAASSEALPAQAVVLNALQHDLTGDDLTEAIDGFAA